MFIRRTQVPRARLLRTAAGWSRRFEDNLVGSPGHLRPGAKKEKRDNQLIVPLENSFVVSLRLWRQRRALELLPAPRA
jgi:hypothetical protein